MQGVIQQNSGEKGSIVGRPLSTQIYRTGKYTTKRINGTRLRSKRMGRGPAATVPVTSGIRPHEKELLPPTTT